MAQQFINTTDTNPTTIKAGGIMINENFTERYNSTGWAQYGDSTYTDVNTLSITEGNSAILSLDGSINTIKSQLPNSVTDFYDTTTSKITPVNIGDSYTMSLSFKGITDNNNGDATIYIDIGGSFTRLFPKSFKFSRGTGVAHEYYFVFNFYTLDTFKANGGTINIESGTGTTEIYDILLQIHKIHNAR